MRYTLLLAGLLMAGCISKPKPQAGGPIVPLGFHEVELTDDFWLPRLKTQKEVLLPFALKNTEPAVENLRKTAKFLAGDTTDLPFPHRYITSDLYKVMEGVALMLKIERDPALEARMDGIIDIIGSAQNPDGYMYEAHITGVSKDHPAWGDAGMGDRPYSWVVHSHELYNMGHMYEAAVAYWQATGKHKWLDIAQKNARHINRVFFVGDPNYNDGKPVNQAPGHEEIELALVKLYRATGDTLYLGMAKRFLDIRGVSYVPEGDSPCMSPRYAQQHRPVREQTEAVGHAVRAVYLYCAMADVAAQTGDTTYIPALDSIWHDIVDTRMHITGGLGAVHGIEGFGGHYELPNAEAYNETCAAVGNVLWNHRMFLMTGDAKYMDVAEVSLYNNVLAGVNLEGNRFFYVNPLETDGERDIQRQAWFGTACCPSNLSRLLPQVSGMMYAHAGDQVYALLYSGNRSEIPLPGGRVLLEQDTQYPYGETIRLAVSPEKEGQEFTFSLRIPTWTTDRFVTGELYRYTMPEMPQWTVWVNGEQAPVQIEKGFASITRAWNPGDVVELRLPMPVKYNRADPRVEDDRGKLAVTKGPLLYCAEGVDNPQGLDAKINPVAETVTQDDRILCGMLELVPYYTWNNRGVSAMKCWFTEQ